MIGRTEPVPHHRTFWGTVMVACIPLIPAVLVMGVQQIKNNERQDAAIAANTVAIQTLRASLDTELDGIALADKRAVAERDRMQERLNLLDQRLSAAEATIKALQPKP
jgi:septal ring factor EnvC (AmiA/AmiB activator)